MDETRPDSQFKHLRSIDGQASLLARRAAGLARQAQTPEGVSFDGGQAEAVMQATSGSSLAPRQRDTRQPAPERRKKQTTRRSILRELMSFLTTIAGVIFFVAALKLFIIDIYSVPTGSMASTIEIDDRILVEKVTIRFTSVNQFEVVTFNDPVREGRVLIKRVIAVGGQTVDLIDGVVYVDGVPLDEPYTRGLPSLPLTPLASVDIEFPYRVPEGEIWVMGDNRTDSLDSRYFGSIEESRVVGRGLLVVWPISHISDFNR